MGKIWYGKDMVWDGKDIYIYMCTAMVWKDMVWAAMSCLIEYIHIQDAVNYEIWPTKKYNQGLGIQPRNQQPNVICPAKSC